jgi:hypothetical protein
MLTSIFLQNELLLIWIWNHVIKMVKWAIDFDVTFSQMQREKCKMCTNMIYGCLHEFMNNTRRIEVEYEDKEQFASRLSLLAQLYAYVNLRRVHHSLPPTVQPLHHYTFFILSLVHPFFILLDRTNEYHPFIFP